MYELWRDTPPSVACRVSFWAGVTLEHIRSGKITQATWLAANGGITESGEERVDRALSMTGEEGSKAIDDCVRTVFRRMSGLPAARGNRSVFVNPTFGRAWWRERIVSRILDRLEQVEERHNLLDIVRRNQQYWENLVTMIVSRGSVFGSTDVQDAVINSLARHTSQHPDTPLRNASTLNRALRRLSNVAASRELGALVFSQIEEIVDDLLERVRQSPRIVDEVLAPPTISLNQYRRDGLFRRERTVAMNPDYTRKPVSQWMDEMYHGELALTDFQRSRVWKPRVGIKVSESYPHWPTNGNVANG